MTYQSLWKCVTSVIIIVTVITSTNSIVIVIIIKLHQSCPWPKALLYFSVVSILSLLRGYLTWHFIESPSPCRCTPGTGKSLLTWPTSSGTQSSTRSWWWPSWSASGWSSRPDREPRLSKCGGTFRMNGGFGFLVRSEAMAKRVFWPCNGRRNVSGQNEMDFHEFIYRFMYWRVWECLVTEEWVQYMIFTFTLTCIWSYQLPWVTFTMFM